MTNKKIKFIIERLQKLQSAYESKVQTKYCGEHFRHHCNGMIQAFDYAISIISGECNFYGRYSCYKNEIICKKKIKKEIKT